MANKKQEKQVHTHSSADTSPVQCSVKKLEEKKRRFNLKMAFANSESYCLVFPTIFSTMSING